MKTILTTLFSVSILATMAIAGPGCSGYKEVTLAEQKSHAHEVLVVEIEGMELFQLTNQECSGRSRSVCELLVLKILGNC